MKQESMFSGVTSSGRIEVKSYPDSPGYKEHTTSKECARSLSKQKISETKKKILELLKQKAMTADELATALEEDRLYIRPRISELRTLGQIIDSGNRNKNKSGKSAIIWKTN